MTSALQPRVILNVLYSWLFFYWFFGTETVLRVCAVVDHAKLARSVHVSIVAFYQTIVISLLVPELTIFAEN